MNITIAEICKLLPCTISDYIHDEICPECIFLFKKAESNISVSDVEQVKKGLENIQVVLDWTWEKLNIGHWKEVSVHLHQLYTLASLVKIVLLIQSSMECTAAEVLREALRVADVGLIVGAPLDLECGKGDLRQVAKVLTLGLNEIYHQDTFELPVNDDCKEVLLFKSNGLDWLEIPVVACPSLKTFFEDFFQPELPVKLTGCISHWPALKLWNNMSYLVKLAGSRMVPVELGAHYVDPTWCQDFMTLSEFIAKHIIGKTGKIGYLAQHRLFDQIPELRADIYEPEYCCLGDSEEHETDINAWFGPSGTLSPLHYDPKHNLLCQVVGTKRVVLYSPQQSMLLYPHEQDPITNTARVDPEQPDYVSFPEFKKAKGWECVLNAGEMLYIPPRWWHHVRSFSTSFSVSFWWE